MSQSDGFIYNYTSVLFDGDWGDIERPKIVELSATKARFKGERDRFFNFRRAIRIKYAMDEVTDLDTEIYMEMGMDVYPLELIAPTIQDMQAIIGKIRDINRVYRRENDFAAVEITGFTVKTVKGKYYGTCAVSATKAPKNT